MAERASLNCFSNHTPLEWRWAPTVVQRFPSKAHRLYLKGLKRTHGHVEGIEKATCHLTKALSFCEDLDGSSRPGTSLDTTRYPKLLTGVW